MPKNVAEKFLIHLLCVCLAASPSIPFATPQAQAQTDESEALSHRAVADAVLDPTFLKFSENVPREMDLPILSSNDSSLDHNPFFINGQHWDEDSTSKDLAYSTQQDSIS